MALWAVLLAGLAAAQLDGDRRSGQVIRCHTCEADFSNVRYDITHPCLVGDRRDNSRDLAQCSRNSRFCKAEVTRQHGLLVSFARSCAEECARNCVTKGFGIVRETCIYCCTNDASCREDIEERTSAVQPRSPKRKNSTSLAHSSACLSAGKQMFRDFALLAAIIYPLIDVF